MTIDKDQLMQLYSLVLGEARHRDRLYGQTWVSGVALASAAFGAMGYLFSQPSFVLRSPIMWALIAVGFLVALLFYRSLAYNGVLGRSCREQAKKIELILAGKKQEEVPKLEDLLITRVITEFRSPRERKAWAILVDPPWRLFWLFVPFSIWTSLCLFLGRYIG